MIKYFKLYIFTTLLYIYNMFKYTVISLPYGSLCNMLNFILDCYISTFNRFMYYLFQKQFTESLQFHSFYQNTEKKIIIAIKLQPFE